jgi:hypothetical protein
LPVAGWRWGWPGRPGGSAGAGVDGWWPGLAEGEHRRTGIGGRGQVPLRVSPRVQVGQGGCTRSAKTSP